jgi:multidrug resistance efflux pump
LTSDVHLAGRRSLRRAIPVAVWLAAVALAWWLHWSLGGLSEATGIAEVRQYTISPAETGRLASVEVVPGERVYPGAIVARLDTEILEGEIAVAEADLREIEAQIPAQGRSLDLTRLETERTFRAQCEEAEVELQAARATHHRDRAELAAVQEELDRQRTLVKQRLANTARMQELQVRLAALQEAVAAWPARVEALEAREKAARQRLETWRATHAGASGTDARRDRLRPLELQLLRQQEYLELLRKRLRNMTLRAPAEAYVTSVAAREGDVLRPGDPVLVLVEADPVQVVAYVNEERGGRLAIGDTASLRSRDRNGGSVTGAIAGISRAVSQLPPRFWPGPTRPRWGREVFVRVAPGHPLDPGEAFDITFRRKPEAPASVAAATDASTPLTPLTVPPAITSRSRFEPSGIVWADSLERYIVVSDDTGLESAGDNAPWVFTLDPGGAVDPDPVVIQGSDGVSDLEAIAMSPNGDVYLLASQSVNRRGRRPPVRTGFLHTRLRGRNLVVEGQVRLHDLLKEAARTDPAFLASLGLPPAVGESGPALEIEGLAFHNGALYLGLKAPLDAGRRALIWKLARPDILFRGGSLARAGLALWGKVPLEVEGEPAGISELLFTDAGLLLLAATNDKGGALFSATHGAGELRGDVLRTFPGLKPEGLCLAADGRRLVVVFDRQQETPLWTHLEMPQ